ncbi:MAG TPA: SIS domain-containing protein [Candidatus Aquilonibacter sp.]|nr:SIS domain-containing protein [Candidatus Aquilonibacter sp.]
MTRFLQDILRQPDELRRVLDHLQGPGHRTLEDAAQRIRSARHVYFTGIGSSWHVAMSVKPLFYLAARPVYLEDAAELWKFSAIPPEAVIVMISRSGRSVEIVNLLAKARESAAFVIGITSSEDAPLAREAQIAILVPAEPDHAISVNAYSSLAAAAGALASVTAFSFDHALCATLMQAASAVEIAIPKWQQQICHSAWPAPGSVSYFLARGGSLGSCHEARLLWEEGVKSPATAMGTSSFRHGPQEMLRPAARFGLWIDAQRMREQDLAVARDLSLLGASTMLIGHDVPEDAGDLVLQLPETPQDWQFLIDIIPAQLAAEHLARLSGVDADSFRYCSYIVEDEYGLAGEKAALPKPGRRV